MDGVEDLMSVDVELDGQEKTVQSVFLTLDVNMVLVLIPGPVTVNLDGEE